MTVKAKIFDNGDFQVNEEYVEIPTELVGGRNLIKDSGVLKYGLTYGLGHYIFGEHVLVEGETYTISAKFEHGSDRSSLTLYSSGGYVALVTLSNNSRDSQGVTRRTFVMQYADGRKPSNNDGYKSLTLYQMSSTGTTPSTIEWVKIEKGNTATPWSPAPEDLGYNIPSYIQNFDSPMQYHDGGIATRELVEIPKELTGSRNLIKLSNVGKYMGGTTSVGSMTNIVKSGNKFTTTGNPIDLIGFVAYNLYGDIITISGETDISVVTYYYTFRNKSGAIIQSQRNSSTNVVGGVFNFPLPIPTDSHSIHIGLGKYPYTVNYSVSKVKIECGSLATPWSSAPEDLGIELPNWIQNFNNPMSINSQGVSITGELIEL